MFATALRTANTVLFLYMVSLFVMEGRKYTFQNCAIALLTGVTLWWIIRAVTCLIVLAFTSFMSYVVLRPCSTV